MFFEQFVSSLNSDPDLTVYRDLIKDARIFVIEKNVFDNPNLLLESKEEQIKLALPFKSCWFEPKQDLIRIPGFYLEKEDDFTWAHVGFFCYEDPDTLNVSVLEYLQLWKRANGDMYQLGPRKIVGLHNVVNEVDLYIKQRDIILNQVLLSLHSGRLFCSNEVVKVKSKLHGKKEFIKIKNIIYIAQKTQNVTTANNGQKIEYSHRFEVRGHWRRINEGSIGKDREGKRGPIGFTWVKECIKGDESLPLVSKIRVMKEAYR